MADQLYLSLWYPNFRFEDLPPALICVLRQFALVAGAPGKRVAAATVYPLSFTESPTFQRLFVNDPRAEDNADTSDSIIENAVAEATEHFHDDMAVEFEMRWNLWIPSPESVSNPESASTPWALRPHTVRILGFGPHFDDAGYDRNGHLRLDFGLDTPWTFEPLEGEPLDSAARQHIRKNVETLLALTLSIEKHCGISSRLLWTESGEALAEKLIAQLQRLN